MTRVSAVRRPALLQVGELRSEPWLETGSLV